MENCKVPWNTQKLAEHGHLNSDLLHVSSSSGSGSGSSGSNFIPNRNQWTSYMSKDTTSVN